MMHNTNGSGPYVGTVYTYPARDPLPGDLGGFMIIRDAGPGPDQNVIHCKTYTQALEELPAAYERREAGGWDYGIYIAALTIVHLGEKAS